MQAGLVKISGEKFGKLKDYAAEFVLNFRIMRKYLSSLQKDIHSLHDNLHRVRRTMALRGKL